MDPIVIGLIAVAVMITAILLGIDVCVAMVATSFIGLWVMSDLQVTMSLVGSTAFNTLYEYLLAAIPLFVIMGLFGNMSGASEDLYESANFVLARVRGGLGMATVMANAVFAAITGSSAVSAAVFSKVAYPQMKRLGYDKKFSLGTVVGSSVLGMLIPPSIMFIIYGLLTEESIGKLFIAGIIPGLVLTVVFCIGIFVMVSLKPEVAGQGRDERALTRGKWLMVVLRPWAFVALILFVLGGIYLGMFTPTEAGALGAFAALVIALIRGRVTLIGLWRVLVDVGYTVGSLFILFIGAQIFSRMLAYSTLPTAITKFFVDLAVPPHVIIILFVIIYLLLGALVDAGSIFMITTPIMFPIVTSLGFDPIWYGVVAVIAIEMGLLTPPFGICVFILKSALGDEITVEEGFRGALPFLLMMVIALIIVFIFPSLSTWLPSQM